MPMLSSVNDENVLVVKNKNIVGKMQTERDQATEGKWDLTPTLVCPQTGPGEREDCPGSPGCDRRPVGGVRTGRNLL